MYTITTGSIFQPSISISQSADIGPNQHLAQQSLLQADDTIFELNRILSTLVISAQKLLQVSQASVTWRFRLTRWVSHYQIFIKRLLNSEFLLSIEHLNTNLQESSVLQRNSAGSKFISEYRDSLLTFLRLKIQTNNVFSFHHKFSHQSRCDSIWQGSNRCFFLHLH